jgi:bacillopeptidase F (M6 metalloprotease family)
VNIEADATLTLRAQAGDEEAVQELADRLGDEVDHESRIIFYPLTMALPRHPEWFETYQVEYRGKGETPFLGWIGRIGASSTWAYDDAHTHEGTCRSQNEALIKLAHLNGVVEGHEEEQPKLVLLPGSLANL